MQVFGRDDSAETRRCLRFFRERRISVSYVDVKRKPPAPGELRRFAERLGAHALLDESSPAYRDAGLGYLRMSEVEVLERLRADPRLLRLPLARFGARVTVGRDEEAWEDWQAALRAEGA